MALSVTPVSRAIGARISGVDLRNADDGTMREIHAAWLEHFVVVIEKQPLTGEEQIAFTEWFGPRQQVRTVKTANAAITRDFMYVANRTVDGMQGVLPDGEMQFHTDQCYYENPSRATILLAIEVPGEGGNTRFANAYAAYDSLPPATRDRIRGLRALNVYDYEANATVKSGESAPDAPRWIPPVVIRHPETGREVLYVNRLMTDHVVGVERAESDDLLEELYEALENPAHCYEHVWTPGDLVMWDNLCTLHARTSFDPVQSRGLRRTSVAGRPPEAAFAEAAGAALAATGDRRRRRTAPDVS